VDGGTRAALASDADAGEDWVVLALEAGHPEKMRWLGVAYIGNSRSSRVDFSLYFFVFLNFTSFQIRSRVWLYKKQ
jgi:hypothetical protein